MAPPKRIKEAKALLSTKADLITAAKPGLDAAIASFNKEFGDNSLYWLVRKSKESSDGWSTDLFGMDYVFGRKGPCRGRIMEISALEGVGKTTMALWMAASAQRKGAVVLYIDQEHTVDPLWAARNGVDLESMMIAQPSSGEEALKLCEMMAGSGLADLVIVDSVPSLIPKEVLDKEPGEASVAAIPRLLNPSISRLNNLVTKSGTNVIFINQMRDIIDRTGFGGPKRYTPGGHGLKYYSSYRFEMIRTAAIKSKSGINVGNEVKIRALKNKCASPFREEMFEIMFWEIEQIWGVWLAADIYNICTQIQLIDPKKRIKTFLPEGLVLGDGEVNAKLAIHRDEEIRDKLTYHIYKIMGYGKPFVFNESLVGKLNSVATNTLAMDLGIDDAPADIEETKVKEESKQALPEINPVTAAGGQDALEALLALATGMVGDNAPSAEPPKVPTFAKPTFSSPPPTPKPAFSFGAPKIVIDQVAEDQASEAQPDVAESTPPPADDMKSEEDVLAEISNGTGEEVPTGINL